MVKRVLSFLLVIVIFSFGYSCQDTSPTNNLKNDLSELNELTQKRNGEISYGKISTFTTITNELGIKVEGKENKLFVLQKEKMALNPNLDNVDGKLIYLNNALVIGTKNKILLLGLNSEKGQNKEILEEIKSKLEPSKTYLGYGLAKIQIEDFAKYNFRNDKSIYYSLLEPTKNPEEIAKLLYDPTCVAGGRGSTSCSTASPSGVPCSTSCSSGYYACCNPVPLSCKCYPDTPHP